MDDFINCDDPVKNMSAFNKAYLPGEYQIREKGLKPICNGFGNNFKDYITKGYRAELTPPP